MQTRASDADFSRWKRQNQQKRDQSKKGAVDQDIAGLVSLLNGLQQFFSTSSCSGRVIITHTSAETSEVQKQNCEWLMVSHQEVTSEQLMEAVEQASGDAVLKFEPFVLHVQCRRLDDAQLMHSVAINSGFRNSGLTVGKTGKIISAVRSTHGLEVPLTHGGSLLVSSDYIHFLCHICNKKMEENLRRIHRFEENLQKALSAADASGLHVPECLSVSEEGPGEGEEPGQTVYRRRRRRDTSQNNTERSDDTVTELHDCRPRTEAVDPGPTQDRPRTEAVDPGPRL